MLISYTRCPLNSNKLSLELPALTMDDQLQTVHDLAAQKGICCLLARIRSHANHPKTMGRCRADVHFERDFTPVLHAAVDGVRIICAPRAGNRRMGLARLDAQRPQHAQYQHQQLLVADFSKH